VKERERKKEREKLRENKRERGRNMMRTFRRWIETEAKIIPIIAYLFLSGINVWN
jgi:hypothetical protein